MANIFIALANKEGGLDFKSDFHKASFRDFLKRFAGKYVRIELAKNPVSDKLRGYYYGAVLPTVVHTIPQWQNFKDEDVHEILKKIHNGFDFFNPVTKRIERVGRSAMGDGSNTERAMEYIAKISQWLIDEYLVELPDPKEYYKKLDEVVMK